MKPKKNNKGDLVFYLVFGAIVYILALFYSLHVGQVFVVNTEAEFGSFSNMTIFDAMPLATEHIKTAPFDIFPINFKIVLIVTFVMLAIAFFVWDDMQKKNKMRPGVEEGSASWMEDMDDYNKKYSSPLKKKEVLEKDSGWADVKTGKPIDLVEYNKNYPKRIAELKAEAQKAGKPFIYKPDIKPINQNMILSDEVFLSMDGKGTRRNCNTVVIGGSGAGKSRFLVKPNVLQENCSYVITDPGGFLMGEIGNFFVERGYDIKLFNLTEMNHSCCYNPFNYIRNEEGVMTMINTLIKNTTPKGASSGDPFWEKSETALLQALCFYLYYECPPEERNFSNICKLLRHAQVKEDQEDYESDVDIMFKILEEENPEHIAVRCYKIFKQAAGKTAKSILISCAVRLQVFNMQAIENLTNVDTIDLMSIGDKPTVLFCIIPIVDTTFNFLVALMYTQLFDSLYHHAATECKSHRLPIPVRFMLDEFANIGSIPEFEQKVATMRNFDISVTIILQNLAQLKTMYKDSWESITGNCDTFIFLGGQEQTTLEMVSKKLGKETIKVKGSSRTYGSRGSSSQSINVKGRDLMTPDEIARMDNGYCIVFLRGELPFFTKKYDYPRHHNYKFTGDADDNKIYRYQDNFNTASGHKEEDYSRFVEEAKAILEQEAMNTNYEDLERAKAPLREETANGIETLQENPISEEFFTELGLRTDELNQLNEFLELEDAYDPDSEYDEDGNYE